MLQPRLILRPANLSTNERVQRRTLLRTLRLFAVLRWHKQALFVRYERHWHKNVLPQASIPARREQGKHVVRSTHVLFHVWAVDETARLQRGRVVSSIMHHGPILSDFSPRNQISLAGSIELRNHLFGVVIDPWSLPTCSMPIPNPFGRLLFDL